MAPRPAAADYSGTSGSGPAEPSRGEAKFRRHLTIYLVTGLFLLTLNLLTSPGELWFYWPLFFWGWALVFQAVATFGAEAPFRVWAVLRSLLPWLPNALAVNPPETQRNAHAAPFAATAFGAAHERIERLKELAWEVPEGPVRDQVLRICARAESIVAVMAADRTDAQTVDWFTTQLLEPTETLLSRYVRLTNRGIAGAEETLQRVEEQNLPRLESRFDALFDQLHRGDIIDLAVASEMLDLEPPTLPATTRISNAAPQVQPQQ